MILIMFLTVQIGLASEWQVTTSFSFLCQAGPAPLEDLLGQTHIRSYLDHTWGWQFYHGLELSFLFLAILCVFVNFFHINFDSTLCLATVLSGEREHGRLVTKVTKDRGIMFYIAFTHHKMLSLCLCVIIHPCFTLHVLIKQPIQSKTASRGIDLPTNAIHLWTCSSFTLSSNR